MCTTSIFKIFFPCLYNFKLPKYRKDPELDPVKIFRIRILPKRSGSGSATLNDMGMTLFAEDRVGEKEEDMLSSSTTFIQLYVSIVLNTARSLQRYMYVGSITGPWLEYDSVCAILDINIRRVGVKL